MGPVDARCLKCAGEFAAVNSTKMTTLFCCPISSSTEVSEPCQIHLHMKSNTRLGRDAQIGAEALLFGAAENR